MAIEKSMGYRKYVQDGLDDLQKVLEQKGMEPIAATAKREVADQLCGYFSTIESVAKATLKAGEHLANTIRILGSETTFKELASVFNIPLRRAYRLKSRYLRLQKLLPYEGLVTAPEDLGSIDPARPFGNYQDVINPKEFPKTGKIEDWNNYWAQVADKYRDNWGERHKGSTKPKELVLRTLYLDFRRRLKQAPAKQRIEVFESIVGMMLAELGISSQRTFKPVAVPSDFKPKRGRPPKKR